MSMFTRPSAGMFALFLMLTGASGCAVEDSSPSEANLEEELGLSFNAVRLTADEKSELMAKNFTIEREESGWYARGLDAILCGSFGPTAASCKIDSLEFASELQSKSRAIVRGIREKKTLFHGILRTDVNSNKTRLSVTHLLEPKQNVEVADLRETKASPYSLTVTDQGELRFDGLSLEKVAPGYDLRWVSTHPRWKELAELRRLGPIAVIFTFGRRTLYSYGVTGSLSLD